MRGAVLTRFLDQGTAALIAANAHRFAAIQPGRACAGCEYPAVAEGEEDFGLFWRTLPWDHAPGVLLVSETGGAALRLDGSAYRPGAPGSDRQSSLRATIAWSHGLLRATEQTLLRRLAVFAAGFSIEAAEGVCADTLLGTDAVLDAVDGLVEKSLVALGEEQTGQRRYRLLETIRPLPLNALRRRGKSRHWRAGMPPSIGYWRMIAQRRATI
jgi:hypothetical protein